MNKTFLYLSVSFLGLVPFNSKANDLQYSAQDKSSELPKYLTPAPKVMIIFQVYQRT